MILEANCDSATQVDQNSRSNLKISYAIVMTWIKWHTEAADFQS